MVRDLEHDTPSGGTAVVVATAYGGESLAGAPILTTLRHGVRRAHSFELSRGNILNAIDDTIVVADDVIRIIEMTARTLRDERAPAIALPALAPNLLAGLAPDPRAEHFAAPDDEYADRLPTPAMVRPTIRSIDRFATTCLILGALAGAALAYLLVGNPESVSIAAANQAPLPPPPPPLQATATPGLARPSVPTAGEQAPAGVAAQPAPALPEPAAITTPPSPAPAVEADGTRGAVLADFKPRDLDADEIEMLLGRAADFLAAGDIATARLMLHRAVEARDPRAALALGATYDPLALAELGVHGTVPDLALARIWYDMANQFGSAEAPRRLELLANQDDRGKSRLTAEPSPAR